jgi:hypothetical protein
MSEYSKDEEREDELNRQLKEVLPDLIQGCTDTQRLIWELIPPFFQQKFRTSLTDYDKRTDAINQGLVNFMDHCRRGQELDVSSEGKNKGKPLFADDKKLLSYISTCIQRAYVRLITTKVYIPIWEVRGGAETHLETGVDHGLSGAESFTVIGRNLPRELRGLYRCKWKKVHDGESNRRRYEFHDRRTLKVEQATSHDLSLRNQGGKTSLGFVKVTRARHELSLSDAGGRSEEGDILPLDPIARTDSILEHLKNRLQALLERLPAHDRKILEMKCDGETFEEIAIAISTPMNPRTPGNVRKTDFPNALRRLTRLIAENPDRGEFPGIGD